MYNPTNCAPSGVSGFTCEPDKLANIVSEFKNDSGKVSAHFKFPKVVGHSFKGSDFINWVMEKENYESRINSLK